MPSKLSRGLLVFALLVIAVLSWQWIDDRAVEPVVQSNRIEMSENQSDYYLQDFEIISISNAKEPDGRTGRLLKVTGKSLSHHYLEGHSTIEHPKVNLHSNNNESWQAEARSGTVSAEFDVLDLQGEVELKQIRPPDKPAMSVDTNSISINTTKRIISSNETVQVTGDGWHYKANSMRAEIDNGTLSFTSGVEAQFANPNSR